MRESASEYNGNRPKRSIALYTAEQMRAMFDAATERAAKPQWQPIESAPMDGSQLLVAGKGWTETDYIVSAYYSEEHRGWWESNTHYTDAADGQVYPTHWMPMPAAPAAAAIRAREDGVAG